MDIEFLSTEKFEADMKRMSKDNQVRIKKRINFLAETLENNSEDILLSTYLQKLKVFANIQPEDSSLYVYRINTSIRLILLFEEDPIFDKYIFTLLRIVQHAELNKVFRNYLSSLYSKEDE